MTEQELRKRYARLYRYISNNSPIGYDRTQALADLQWMKDRLKQRATQPTQATLIPPPTVYT